jgi:GAF domain-containing protein
MVRGFEKTGTGFEARWKMLEAARLRLRGAHSQQEIIAVVRQMARAICSADGVTFVLRDGDKCHYVEEDAIAPLWRGQRFPLTACISGWAMINGKTAAIEDIYVDNRIPHDAYRKTFVKSLVMVPVRAYGEVAAIGAYWADQRELSVQEIAVIEALADAVGEALKIATSEAA